MNRAIFTELAEGVALRQDSPEDVARLGALAICEALHEVVDAIDASTEESERLANAMERLIEIATSPDDPNDDDGRPHHFDADDEDDD